MVRQCEVLIVGAGLAGSLLAYHLKKSGKSVFITHDPSMVSASRVAAGLINPVSGKRLVLQENINVLLPFSIDFYQQLETEFDAHFLTHKLMLRMMASEKECKIWSKRCENEAYEAFLGEKVDEKSIKHHFSSFLQHKTSFLDTNALLDALQAWFKQHDCLIESIMDYDEIDVQLDAVSWRDVRATKVIFCEGWRGQNNPWFEWLPFQAAKGEILTLKSKDSLPDKILNWGRWMLPLEGDIFKLGATYDRERLDEQVTPSAQIQLLESLNSILLEPVRASVVEHQAGIRPGTRDKQPFIGTHPKHPSLGIFNGFGSKGSLLIPWFADQCSQHLCHGTPLPNTANITRFYES